MSMMTTISEQLTQLSMSNRERGSFLSQPKVNLREGPSPSLFDPDDVRKVNFVISL